MPASGRSPSCAPCGLRGLRRSGHAHLHRASHRRAESSSQMNVRLSKRRSYDEIRCRRSSRNWICYGGLALALRPSDKWLAEFCRTRPSSYQSDLIDRHQPVAIEATNSPTAADVAANSAAPPRGRPRRQWSLRPRLRSCRSSPTHKYLARKTAARRSSIPVPQRLPTGS